MCKNKPFAQNCHQTHSSHPGGTGQCFKSPNCVEGTVGVNFASFADAHPGNPQSVVYAREFFPGCSAVPPFSFPIYEDECPVPECPPATPECPPECPPECCCPGPFPPATPGPAPLLNYKFVPGFLRVYIGDSVRVDFLQPPSGIAPCNSFEEF